MDFQTRRERALALLEQTGMPRGSYASPMFRALWRLGVDVPPPHFMGFWPVFALTAVWFGFAWGCIMWLMIWSRQHMDARFALGGACGAGLFFGLAVALYYAHGRKKHALPSWASLGEHPIP